MEIPLGQDIVSPEVAADIERELLLTETFEKLPTAGDSQNIRLVNYELFKYVAQFFIGIGHRDGELSGLNTGRAIMNDVLKQAA